jgi:hypothetical protein
MDEEALRPELDRVSSELAKARVEHASLAARIAGLEAQQSALRKTLERSPTAAAGAAPRHRTDAIVAVLATSDTEMSIQDVIAGLRETGRPDEAYDNVAADLAYLSERGRVRRVRRGVYAAASA